MRFPVLDSLDGDTRSRLIRAGQRRRFRRSEVVFHEGDPANALHLLMVGHVSVRVTTPMGDTAILAVLGPGATFGELALLSDNRLRAATVAALDPVETFVTLFDDLLQRALDDRLTEHLPLRVLPVSAYPPQDLAIVLDQEYSQIAALLKPGRRARHQARARIRTLLAMEAHVEPEARVSSKDVDRVERGIRDGDPRDQVFPRLSDIATVIDGAGVAITVHFTKKQGVPVRYEADESVPAAAVREVDLQRKYHRSAADLAAAVNLSSPRALALRRHLGIDDDKSCYHDFVFGAQRHRCYSDNAYTKMRDAAQNLDMAVVWDAHRPRVGSKPVPPCTIPGCQAELPTNAGRGADAEHLGVGRRRWRLQCATRALQWD